MRFALIVGLLAPLSGFASSPDDDAAAALALAKAARERVHPELVRRGGGWIPGTNPPVWSDTWTPPPAGEWDGWVKPLVKPFDDWNVTHWDTPKKAAAPSVAYPYYPPSPVGGIVWTGCDDWTHMTTGQHAGKYPADWLKGLGWSQLQALHSDDHEGRVRWQYVPVQQTVPLTTYAEVVVRAATATSRHPVHFASGVEVPAWAPKDTVRLSDTVPGHPAGVYRAWMQGNDVVFQRMYPRYRESGPAFDPSCPTGR